jgi:hypothetical protein
MMGGALGATACWNCQGVAPECVCVSANGQNDQMTADDGLGYLVALRYLTPS